MNFFYENWQAITGIIGAIIAFFSGKSVRESDALTSMQANYKTWIDDFDKKYNDLKEELKIYRNEQLQLRQEITQLRSENDELRKELRVWEQKYTKLKKEFDLTQK